MVIFEKSCSLSIAQLTIWKRAYHEKVEFFAFFAPQRAQKVSLYTLPGFKSRQIPRGRSLQNIMIIAHELARKFGKNLPPPNLLVLESGSLYPLLATMLKKSFQNFWGLDFPLEILREWFWNPVGFLKENQDLKNFENFFFQHAG